MRWQVSIFLIFILHQLCIGLGCQAYMVVSGTPELCGLDGIHPLTLNLNIEAPFPLSRKHDKIKLKLSGRSDTDA